jgi:protein TonB
VKVKFTVDVQGNVSDPTVESSSNPGFDKAAIDAIKKWKFKPATQDGTPIAKAVSIPLKFTLDS